MKLPLLRAAIERYPQLAEVEGADLTAYRRLAEAMSDGRLAEQRLGGAELLAVFALTERAAETLRRLPAKLVEGVIERWRQAVGEDKIQRLIDTARRQYAEPEAGFAGGSSVELLLVLWWLNQAPAFERMRELFDDRSLRGATDYDQAVAALVEILESELEDASQLQDGLLESILHPTSATTLLEYLDPAGPAERTPEPPSACGELEAAESEESTDKPRSAPGHDRATHIETEADRVHTADDRALLRTRDLVIEEMPRMPPGPPRAETPRLRWGGEEWGPRRMPVPPPVPPEKPWMKDLVLIAKQAKVWLHQLGRELGIDALRLDQVPDRELDRLAECGMNGLWLIGVWQRSPASLAIKRRLGDHEAAASAYSIFDYRVADELGGDDAMDEFQERALERGILIGVDVVPNHLGVDSEWVRRYPERFLSLDRPPYPSYDFDGPDLSADPGIGVFLERHYYDQSDAAVVFRRLDRRTGEERFLYHGNDGTGMPWNDTAQLDYLNPEVRTAMIELIVGLARRFPILRFDAAMTLTRYHYQRLWFPPPGSGGAIPSRSEHGMEVEDFERQMPTELWRDVCERVAHDQIDCLLVAEAFWLMEAYFVGELGMHRVYNSAFMHMMRERDQAGFRRLVAETERENRSLLGRYVSFLSNPDERTARDQFGDGDRYFGACTLLATLPGLPLFAHGQFAGSHEKYGMEFSRPRHEEGEDRHLVERHLREITPLLRRRGRFAGTDDFRLLSFVDQQGHERDDVIAFRNGVGDDLVVVVGHQGDESLAGKIVGVLDRRLPADGETGSEPAERLVLRELRGEELVAGSVVVDDDGAIELWLSPFQCLVLAPREGERSEQREIAETAPSSPEGSDPRA